MNLKASPSPYPPPRRGEGIVHSGDRENGRAEGYRGDGFSILPFVFLFQAGDLDAKF